MTKLTGTGLATAPASASSGCCHDLMDAPVTQAELLGDLAQRPSCHLEPTYCRVELGAGDLSVMLGIDDASLRGSLA
jgi:hypothetical protein